VQAFVNYSTDNTQIIWGLKVNEDLKITPQFAGEMGKKM
jgi:hypothetical protein